MTPKSTAKLTFTVLAFDTLGIILAIWLSYQFHGVIFDIPTWLMTFLPLVILGTGIGVWQAMKELQGPGNGF